VQRGGHLGGSGAARFGISHGERGGDALGREKEIAVPAPQLSVEMERKGVIAVRDGGLVRRERWRCLRQSGGALQEKKKGKHVKQWFH